MTQPAQSPFHGQNILVTGGAGYLGRGLLRYLERERIGVGRITVYSRDEHKHHALKVRYPHVRTVLGDIRDTARLEAVATGHDILIHAGAVKYIPEAERDVSEAIGVNVIGSQSVAIAALRAGVRRVVGISTDKVCSPVNVYGATKMLMERAFQEAGRLGGMSTVFTNVRYGNVVSSTGSVVPLFMEQIRRDGEVSITHADMTRFWIAIDDAVRLIERALRAPRGSTCVAFCQAMRVCDVAQACWELAGNENSGVATRIIGVRPGEKLHETLIDASEARYGYERDGYAIIPAALNQTGEPGGEGLMPYTSSHPRSWMSPGMMATLILDSEQV